MSDLVEKRKEMQEWASKNLLGKKSYVTVLQKIVIYTKQNIRHSLSRHYKFPMVEIEMIKQFPSLLNDAMYAQRSENHKLDKKPMVKYYHDFFTVAFLKDKLYSVFIKLEEYQDGHLEFYDFGIHE